MKSLVLTLLVLVVPSARAQVRPNDLLFQELVRGDPGVSVEDILELLPVQFRTNPVLMYRSKSSQGADFQNPRAILFDREAGSPFGEPGLPDSLMMAFNGDPFQAGNDRLEMIQYVGKSRSYRFSEIVFGPAGAVFHASPARCFTCHGQEGRPNWSAYPYWPGAYRSEDGVFSSNGTEFAEFRKFYEGNAKKGRYAKLFLAYPREGFDGADEVPTKTLANKLSDQNLAFAAQKIVETRHYDAYRFAFQGAFGRCGNLEDFIPSELRMPRSLGDLRQETQALQLQHYLKTVGEVYSFRPAPSAPQAAHLTLNFSAASNDVVAGLRYLLERDGVPISSLFFSKDPTAFNTSRSNAMYIGNAVPGSNGSEMTPAACASLAAQSRSALSELARTVPDPLATGRKAPLTAFAAGGLSVSLAKCMECHADSESLAPSIPFGNEAALGPALWWKPRSGKSTRASVIMEALDRLRRTDALQMPPDGALAPADRSALADYLQDLAARQNPQR